MFAKRERLTSKNLVTMQIATSALKGELFLPGTTKPRVNSLTPYLLDRAQTEGEQTSIDYKALLAVKIKKHQEEKTPKNLGLLVEAYDNYATHLSVLRLYYHYCLQQALTVKEKREYGQCAMNKSTELLQQIESILILCDADSDVYTQTLEKKTEYTVLDDALKAELTKLNSKKRSAAEPNHYAQSSKFLKPAPQAISDAPNLADDEVASKLTF